MIVKETKKIVNLKSLYLEINIIIKIVDKFNRKKAVLSPDIKIKTSIKKGKLVIEIPLSEVNLPGASRSLAGASRSLSGASRSLTGASRSLTGASRSL